MPGLAVTVIANSEKIMMKRDFESSFIVGSVLALSQSRRRNSWLSLGDDSTVLNLAKGQLRFLGANISDDRDTAAFWRYELLSRIQIQISDGIWLCGFGAA
jgi:hypothetical protein